jgi:hypothetical protein
MLECLGHPCQKHPSTNTARLRDANCGTFLPLWCKIRAKARMTVTIELHPTLEARLRHTAAKLGVDAGAYVAAALEGLLGDSRGASAHLSATESELVQQINLGIAPETWQRYHDLVEKRRNEALTSEEHRSLIDLSDEIEQANTLRMGYVAELAKLRGASLDAVMQQLGITPGSNA